MMSKPRPITDLYPENYLEDLPEKEPSGEQTTEGDVSQIWLEVTGPMKDGLAFYHKCLKSGQYDPLAIINFAEAVSNAITKDIDEHPEWIDMDNDPNYGPLPDELGSRISGKHFRARMKVIRKLERFYHVAGRKAPEGEPDKFLSLASQIPKEQQ